MKKTLKTLLLAGLAGAIAAAASNVGAQQAPKPEALIKWRQSAFQVLAWNTARVKVAVDGNYNKEQVVKAATTIAAVANSGLGTLFAPGSETGKGWHDTSARPELFTNTAKVGELFADLSKESNELLRVAAGGDTAALKEQFGKLSKTCKSCHDDFRVAN